MNALDPESAFPRGIAKGGGSSSSALTATLGAAFFLVPLYPAFISLTGAPVPGVALLAKPLALALLCAVGLMVAFWAWMLLASPREPLPTVLPMAAFPAAGVVAALLGFDPLAGALFTAILFGGVIWHATVLRFVRTPHAVVTVLRAYLISGAAASLAAIVMVAAKTPATLYVIGHGRAIGTFVLPGELAGYLIVYVPVALAVARTGYGSRTLASTGLVLGSIACALTFSRAGWVGMAAAIAALVVMQRRGRGIRYAVAIVGTAIVIVGLAFNLHHDPSENFTRLSFWNAALQMIVRFPFSGVGPFQFEHVYPLVRAPGGEPAAYHAHSVLLTIASVAGIVGIAALLLGWWRFVIELRSRLRSDSTFRSVAVAIAAGLAGTWVQGLIDTVSVVIFGLWLPFTALALVCADAEPPARRAPSPPRARRVAPRRVAAIVALSAFALLCAFVQTASSAVYASAAAPLSLAAHFPPSLGTSAYETIERIAPLPFVESVLAEDALRRGDLAAAQRHAARLSAGPSRSDFLARIAAARGRTADATALFLDAGDDEALQPFIGALAGEGHLRDAYDLERRLRDRLAAAGTRPNALAESWWHLGCLAIQLRDGTGAERDYDNAMALAPLNTKYLLDAAQLRFDRGDEIGATKLRARALEIDPTRQSAGATASRCATRLRTR